MIAIGGSVFTEVTSAGGGAITLASSGAGVVTSFAGSVYTVATSAASSAASGYAPTAVHYHDQADDPFVLGMRAWRTFARYISQCLCSPHSLQQLAVCYSVLGRLFKRV
jgi:hypothetical protein